MDHLVIHSFLDNHQTRNLCQHQGVLAIRGGGTGTSIRHGATGCCSCGCCCCSCCCICIACHCCISIYCQCCCICRPWSFDCCWCSRLMTILQGFEKNKTLAIKKGDFAPPYFICHRLRPPMASSIRPLATLESCLQWRANLFLQQSRDFTPCSNLACAKLCSNKNEKKQ